VERAAARTRWSSARWSAAGFPALGVGKGDRVAAMMPNMPETVAAMLAAASIGAIWSSCSPDFGEQGVLDRFGQIEPKLFIACDGYWYNGKRRRRPTRSPVVAKLPTVPQPSSSRLSRRPPDGAGTSDKGGG
jgi:acetoacetyl-CoA synthetase